MTPVSIHSTCVLNFLLLVILTAIQLALPWLTDSRTSSWAGSPSWSVPFGIPAVICAATPVPTLASLCNKRNQLTVCVNNEGTLTHSQHALVDCDGHQVTKDATLLQACPVHHFYVRCHLLVRCVSPVTIYLIITDGTLRSTPACIL